MHAATRTLIRIAPTVTAVSLMAGNTGLLVRRGFHPNLETAVGLLWIASDFALRAKPRHPVAAPRLNATGVILGSLLLATTGFHPGAATDWNRVRTPLGYIPAALIIGFQNELRRLGQTLSARPSTRPVGAILQHPYTLSALCSLYGVTELMQSALHRHDHGLVAIASCYALGVLFLALFDYTPRGLAHSE